MSGQNTGNTTAFIEAQQYSGFILENLKDGLMPGAFFRNVSDFPAGTTLNIKTIGTASIQEVAEDQPIVYSPIETGSVTLSITDYVGDAWYVTDVLRQDGTQIEQLMAARAAEATRAIQENFETRALAVLNAAQTADNNNTVNGFYHRRGASGANGQFQEVDLIEMRLAFDKANVPAMGRVAIVDPVVAATLNKLVLLTSGTNYNVANHPVFKQLVEDGFDRDHQFVTMLHGWMIWTSNRLPRITSAETSLTGGDSDAKGVGAIANIFMSIADDGTKPLMSAWRQMPSVEGERNKDKGRDEFVTRARWGLGVQREDTLGVVLCHPTATA
jgi:hypothetical protein